MPLAVTVAPNPVHVPVAMFIMPDVFLFQNMTIMTSGLMRRPVEFNPVRNRQRIMKLWRCFRAGKTHDTGQRNYNQRSFQHFLHTNHLLYLKTFFISQTTQNIIIIFIIFNFIIIIIIFTNIFIHTFIDEIFQRFKISESII